MYDEDKLSDSSSSMSKVGQQPNADKTNEGAGHPSPPHAPHRSPSGGGRAPPSFVTQLNSNDVLLGRGAPFIDNEGNIRLRRLVQSRRAEYTSTQRRHHKDAIARQIISAVGMVQGRFLRKIEDAAEARQWGVPPLTDAWLEVEEQEALTKVKQALRDRNAGTTDPEGPKKRKRVTPWAVEHSANHGNESPRSSHGDSGGEGEDYSERTRGGARHEARPRQQQGASSSSTATAGGATTTAMSSSMLLEQTVLREAARRQQAAAASAGAATTSSSTSTGAGGMTALHQLLLHQHPPQGLSSLLGQGATAADPNYLLARAAERQKQQELAAVRQQHLAASGAPPSGGAVNAAMGAGAGIPPLGGAARLGQQHGSTATSSLQRLGQQQQQQGGVPQAVPPAGGAASGVTAALDHQLRLRQLMELQQQRQQQLLQSLTQSQQQQHLATTTPAAAAAATRLALAQQMLASNPPTAGGGAPLPCSSAASAAAFPRQQQQQNYPPPPPSQNSVLAAIASASSSSDAAARLQSLLVGQQRSAAPQQLPPPGGATTHSAAADTAAVKKARPTSSLKMDQHAADKVSSSRFQHPALQHSSATAILGASEQELSSSSRRIGPLGGVPATVEFKREDIHNDPNWTSGQGALLQACDRHSKSKSRSGEEVEAQQPRRQNGLSSSHSQDDQAAVLLSFHEVLVLHVLCSSGLPVTTKNAPPHSNSSNKKARTDAPPPRSSGENSATSSTTSLSWADLVVLVSSFCYDWKSTWPELAKAVQPSHTLVAATSSLATKFEANEGDFKRLVVTLLEKVVQTAAGADPTRDSHRSRTSSRTQSPPEHTSAMSACLEEDLCHWAQEVGVLDPTTRRPMPFASEDVAATFGPLAAVSSSVAAVRSGANVPEVIQPVARLSAAAARTVCRQIALMTRIRSMLHIHTEVELSDFLQCMPDEATSSWTARPAWWGCSSTTVNNNNRSIVRDLWLLKNLALVGFAEILDVDTGDLPQCPAETLDEANFTVSMVEERCWQTASFLDERIREERRQQILQMQVLRFRSLLK